MLEGFITGLFVGFILTIFDIDEMILEVVQPFIKTINLTNSHYYVFFGLIGLLGGAFQK